MDKSRHKSLDRHREGILQKRKDDFEEELVAHLSQYVKNGSKQVKSANRRSLYAKQDREELEKARREKQMRTKDSRILLASKR